MLTKRTETAGDETRTDIYSTEDVYPTAAELLQAAQNAPDGSPAITGHYHHIGAIYAYTEDGQRKSVVLWRRKTAAEIKAETDAREAEE